MGSYDRIISEGLPRVNLKKNIHLLHGYMYTINIINSYNQLVSLPRVCYDPKAYLSFQIPLTESSVWSAPSCSMLDLFFPHSA